MKRRMTVRISLRPIAWKKLTLAVAGMAALAVPMVVPIVTAAQGQSQLGPVSASKPKFEVASIRPGCGGRGKGAQGQQKGGAAIPASSPGRLSVCGPLAENMGGLIQQAYFRFANGRRNPPWGVLPVEGGPPWVHSDSYAISARADGDASLEMMYGPMLQALLEDRFQLKIHRETRDVPVYALTVAKGGVKLKAFKEGSCVPIDFAKVPYVPPDLSQRNCNDMIRLAPAPNLTVEAQGASLEVITFLLGLTLDRPVIDKTGLTGLFDLHLEFARDQSTSVNLPPGVNPAEPFDPAGAPSIFTAVQQELGLKLDPMKGPREVLVIDHVERPSEN
jgi:uncharacterized protein (TIGR03435 family)